MRLLVLSEGREEAESRAQDDDEAAGDTGVPHVGDLVDLEVAPPHGLLLRAQPQSLGGGEVPRGWTLHHLHCQLLCSVQLLQSKYNAVQSRKF